MTPKNGNPIVNPSVNLTLCNGVTGGACRFALPVPPGLEGRLLKVVDDSGWTGFLRTRTNAPIRHHSRFTIAVAGCANGCSRPHIADFGMIRAHHPEVDLDLCTNCGTCAETCPDKAITLPSGAGPVIDPDLCLRCGQCAKACPESALDAGMRGFRVLVGGHLGRHPRLAVELPGLLAQNQALAVLDRCLRHFMDNYRPGMRFGRVLFAQGVDAGLKAVAP